MNGGAGMGIVKDYKIGNTSIKIADDYCLSKTDEEDVYKRQNLHYKIGNEQI